VIGDLKERRESWVNPGARTYSVLDYDKVFGPPPTSGQRAAPKQQNSGIKVPPVSAASTGKTQILMGQASQQVVGKLTENADEYYEVESWLAPSVVGFNEIKDFYSKLSGTYASKLPGTYAVKDSSSEAAASAAAALKTTSELWLAMEMVAAKAPVAGPSMTRVISDICGRDSAAKGLPVLQALRMVRMMTAEQQATPTPGGPPAAAKSAPPGNRTSTRSAVTEAEFTLRVTSYSAEHLEESLFQVPSGYVATESSKKDTWPAAILP